MLQRRELLARGDSQEKTSSSLMDHTGGRWLVGLVGLVVIGVGIGLVVYGYQKKFEKHLNTEQMTPTVRQPTRRLGMAGYWPRASRTRSPECLS